MDYKLWIDGKWVDSQGGGTITVENPATGKKIAEVVDASPEDVNRAVEAARRAFYDGRWSRLVPSERSKAIWRLADLLEKHQTEFAKLESENTGKPYKFVSLGADLMFSIDNLRFFAGRGARHARFACGRILAGIHIPLSPRAGWRGGADRAVELPADDGHLEDRAGAGCGLHHGLQTGLPDAAQQPHAGGDHPGSGHSGWGCQYYYRPKCRKIAGGASGRAAHQRHGFHGSRAEHHAHRGDHGQTAAPGARRQGARTGL